MTGIELLVMLRERNIEQREIARRIGLTHPMISNYIRGKTPISPKREQQIRRAIDDIMREREAEGRQPPQVPEAATA